MARLTAERARALLDYDPGTGVLTWKRQPDARPQWNGLWPGRRAGCTHCHGYRIVRIDNVGYAEHRVVWLIVYGQWPKGQVDHLNHNRSDNRISNLRDASREQNARNRKKYSCNKSGHTGVIWYKASAQWEAVIRVNGYLHNLGRYDDIEDAIAARVAAERRFGFHKNHGREAA